MRDFLVLAAVYGSIPAIPFFPFYGLLVFAWLAYMRPHDLAYGLGGTRLSFYVGIAIILGLILAALRGKEKILTLRLQTWLMIGLLIWVRLSTQFSLNMVRALRELDKFEKALLISLVTTGLVLTWRRFRILLIVISFSLGALAAKYGLYGLVRGGANFDEGPGGFMTDNNGFAVALNMALPLLIGIALYERMKWLRVSAMLLAASCVITIIFTFSRGGLLSLGVVTTIILLRIKRPGLAVAMLGLGAVLFLFLTPESFQQRYYDRASSIADYQEEESASTRIEMWHIAFQVSRDFPVFGVGPDNFVEIFGNYSSGQFHAAHNAFFQLLSECGYPAAALWVSLILVTLLRLEKIRRQDNPSKVIYATALQTSIFGYVVGSMFLDKAIFDLFYQLAALSVCLEVIDLEGQSESDGGLSVTTGEAWWRRNPTITTNTMSP